MATYNPPTNLEPINVFNPANFMRADTNLTQAQADTRYLRFPIAQGTEYLQNAEAINFDVGANLTLSGTDGVNYIQFPNGSKQYVASTSTNILPLNNTFTGTNAFNNVAPITSSATQPASTDSSTKIPTTAWVQGAISGSSAITPIISSAGISPLQANVIGTWQVLSTPAGTQFCDVYTMGGGGNSGGDATNPTLGWSKGIGGCGGGGGMTLNSRLSYGGALTNAFGVLNQPQFVCGTTNSQGQNTNITYTNVWNGTFTQSGTNITLVSTTSGAMSVGTIITFTKSTFDTIYPTSTAPYGAYFNQLQVVSGSANSWVVQSQQSQTLNVAITGAGYTPQVMWEGTFTQAGTTITAVSTTSGSFSNFNASANNSYLVCNGTSANTQLLRSITDASNNVVNSSQTISTPIAGRILFTQVGNNVLTRYWTYGAGMNNSYTLFPYISWCEGGFRGINGTTNGSQEFGGAGGVGGQVITYNPSGAQTALGAKGQNGGVNGDPSGFTKISGQGGYANLIYNKTMTINGVSQQLYQYNQGSSTFSPSAFAVNHYAGGVGGMILVCYKY